MKQRIHGGFIGNRPKKLGKNNKCLPGVVRQLFFFFCAEAQPKLILRNHQYPLSKKEE